MTLDDHTELRRLTGAAKVALEELSKQNYSSVEMILRELDKRLDLLARGRPS